MIELTDQDIIEALEAIKPYEVQHVIPDTK